MAIRGGYARAPKIQAEFTTDQYTLSMTNVTSTTDTDRLVSGGMTNGIISFTTTNDMNEDSATFSIVAVGTKRWDKLLEPNDIITLRVNPGDGNPVENDVVMVGMIGDIKRIGQYADSSILYQITGNSMMKALMQLKLGTLQELSSLLGTNGWMIGMGGLEGASDQLGGSDDDDSKADGDKGKYKQDPDSVLKKKKVASRWYKNYTKFHKDQKELAIKSSLKVKVGEYINVENYGLAKVVGYTDKDVGAWLDSPTSGGDDIILNFATKKKAKAWNTRTIDILNVYKSKPDKANKGSDDSDTIEDSQGITLFNKSASEVFTQLYDWFITQHTHYYYQSSTNTAEALSVSDFIEQDFTSQAGEHLSDPTPIMSYEGSLRQLFADNMAKPFNEFFADFTKDGKMKMTLRPTPFEPEDWRKLEDGNVNLVRGQDVIEETIGRSNAESYSIFMARMPSSIVVGELSSLLSYPLYFPALAERYGYSILSVENPYIFSLKVESTDGGSESGSTGNTNGVTSAEASAIGKTDMGWVQNKHVNADNINKWIKSANSGSRFNGTGQDWMDGAKKSGLDPVILLAFGALESAWGNSQMGQANAFFGIGAFDNNPNNGFQYSNATKRDGIMSGMQWIRNNYYNAGQKTLYSFFNNGGVHQYSTTPDEYIRIGSIAGGFYKMFPEALQKSKALRDGLGNNGIMGGGNTPITDNKPSTGNGKPKGDSIYHAVNKGKGHKKKKGSDRQTSSNEAKTDAKNATNLKQYSTLLANWYVDNTQYLSGELRVVGHPDYRIGNILERTDESLAKASEDVTESMLYEYYIESVGHEFNLASGYTTTLGVTRGLNEELDRFAHWNNYEDALNASKPGAGDAQLFLGGLFGEMSLKESVKKAEEDSGSSKNGDSDSGGTSKGSGDDYPDNLKKAGKDSVVDPWGSYNRECSSFASWRISQQKDWKGKTPWVNPGHMNGADFATNPNLKHLDKPSAGTIAVWRSANTPNHVGWVKSVTDDGTKIFTEEYNWVDASHPGGDGAYHTRWIQKGSADYPTDFMGI